LDAFAVMPEHIHGIVVLLDTFEVDGVRTERADLKSQAGNAWAGLKPA
jgi:REP element-mobilizing transposase RayT